MDPVRRGPPATARRPGGRSARANAAIQAAVIELLVTVGYTNLTMDAVSTRACVHRATLYRRWPNKESLVAAALSQLTEQAMPIPDTGSVDADLQLLIASVLRNLEGAGGGIIRAFVGEASRVPEVENAGRALWEYRLGLAATVVRRGIERGELPDIIDPDAFVEEMVAPIFFRTLITGKPVGAEFARARVCRELNLARRPPKSEPDCWNAQPHDHQPVIV